MTYAGNLQIYAQADFAIKDSGHSERQLKGTRVYWQARPRSLQIRAAKSGSKTITVGLHLEVSNKSSQMACPLRW